jgi:hypothetical protein
MRNKGGDIVSSGTELFVCFLLLFFVVFFVYAIVDLCFMFVPQNGRTRSKTEDRQTLCNFLAAFPRLCRLDLGYNFLQVRAYHEWSSYEHIWFCGPKKKYIYFKIYCASQFFLIHDIFLFISVCKLCLSIFVHSVF